MTRPKVSVVVAVLNAAGTLQRLLDSVAAQEGVTVELLVADGGSTDGTLEVLRANEHRLAFLSSGPDRGVYSAWNKALPQAAGEWVCFLGADDRFATAGELARVVEAGERAGADLVCSRVRYEQPGDRVVGQPWEWSKMVRFMCVAHPGLLHRRELFDRAGPFAEEYRIAADYEFLLRLGSEVSAAFVDEATVVVGGAGLSSDTMATLREMRLVQSRQPGIGPARACVNFLKCVAEQRVWNLLDRLPFRLPQNAAFRSAGGLLGLHRHDYDPGR